MQILNNVNKNLTKSLLLLLIITFILPFFNIIFFRNRELSTIWINNIKYLRYEWQNNIKAVTYGYEIPMPATQNDLLKKDLFQRIKFSSLLNIKIRKIGLIISSNILKKEIVSFPTLLYEKNFNKKLLNEVLKKYHLNNKGFLDEIRTMVLTHLIISLFFKNNVQIFMLINQTIEEFLKSRFTTFVRVPYLCFKFENHPFLNELKLVYNKYTPILFKQKVVYYSIASNIDTSPRKIESKKKIKNFYFKNKYFFRIGEKRVIQGVFFYLRKKRRQKNNSLIVNNKNKIAKYTDIKGANIFIDIIKEDMEQKIIKELFLTKKKYLTKTISTPLGFYIFKIKNITSQYVKNLIQMKKLINKINREKNLYFFIQKLKEIRFSIDNGEGLHYLLVNKSLFKNNLLNFHDLSININNKIIYTRKVLDRSKGIQLFSINEKNFYLLKHDKHFYLKKANFYKSRRKIIKTWIKRVTYKKKNQIYIDIKRGNILNTSNLLNCRKIKLSSCNINRNRIYNYPSISLIRFILNRKNNNYSEYFNSEKKELLFISTYNKTNKLKNFSYKQTIRKKFNIINKEIMLKLFTERFRRK